MQYPDLGPGDELPEDMRMDPVHNDITHGRLTRLHVGRCEDVCETTSNLPRRRALSIPAVVASFTMLTRASLETHSP